MSRSQFHSRSRFLPALSLSRTSLLPVILLLGSIASDAKPRYKNDFISFYPSANNSALDSLPSSSNHCGICHYDFGGNKERNPYGVSLIAIAQNEGLDIRDSGDRATIFGHADAYDQDGDGFPTSAEMDGSATNDNRPTFPGLSNLNVSNVSDVTQTEVEAYLIPLIDGDTDPPSVTVTAPIGGEMLTANQSTTVAWTASDSSSGDSGIAAIHLYLSLDGGTTFIPLELGLSNTPSSYTWTPANRPSTSALIRVVAVDGAANISQDDSDAVFTISSPSAPVSTTLRDFDMPGSQPFEDFLETENPDYCASCHGNFNAEHEPYATWGGSMMAHASLDPLFLANMAIANQDAPESGDLCLRCHNSRGWLRGRSVPTDGSRMEPEDQRGVSCDLCHRMVDPDYQVGISPAEDEDLLTALRFPFPTPQYGNGMMVIAPPFDQRGPFADAAAPHIFLESPFHQSSDFCGTCHDVSNPAFTKDGDGIYQLNDLDTSAPNFSPHSMAPVERTYSEWLNSEYAATGVYQPEFAGNKADGIVSSCQDCHMRDIVGTGCNPDQGSPIRQDLALHDMTGGSTWIASLLPALHPDAVDPDAIQAGIDRSRYMLQNAADLEADVTAGELVVTVTNQTGHKLPTGYPEGRRIWVNVKFFDSTEGLISESCAYDPATGELDYDYHDPEDKVYEVHPGIGENIAGAVGLPVGPSLHFVLNNEIFVDNRIPPRGFDNEKFAEFGGAPVGYSYADGHYWDETPYAIPGGTVRAEVKLYYQSTSKEFVEFLRDENQAPAPNAGTEMYELWVANDRCPPELMEETTWTAPSITFGGLENATPGVESATLSWSAAGSSNTVTYHVYHSTTSGGQDFGSPPLLTTENLSVEVSPLDPGSTSPLTHYFVVRATDSEGANETNTVERSVQPLLDTAKDQDGDGMWNGFEETYSLDPFSTADASQDPDKDGLTNLEEAAFGSDPRDPASANRPIANEDDPLYFALSYTRVKGLTTATITAEVSDDLLTWDSGRPTYTVISSVTDNGDNTETVIERMTSLISSSPRDFMRLEVAPSLP